MKHTSVRIPFPRALFEEHIRPCIATHTTGVKNAVKKAKLRPGFCSEKTWREMRAHVAKAHVLLPLCTNSLAFENSVRPGAPVEMEMTCLACTVEGVQLTPESSAFVRRFDHKKSTYKLEKRSPGSFVYVVRHIGTIDSADSQLIKATKAHDVNPGDTYDTWLARNPAATLEERVMTFAGMVAKMA